MRFDACFGRPGIEEAGKRRTKNGSKFGRKKNRFSFLGRSKKLVCLILKMEAMQSGNARSSSGSTCLTECMVFSYHYVRLKKSRFPSTSHFVGIRLLRQHLRSGMLEKISSYRWETSRTIPWQQNPNWYSLSSHTNQSYSILSLFPSFLKTRTDFVQ